MRGTVDPVPLAASDPGVVDTDDDSGALPPLSCRRQLARAMLVVVAALALGAMLELFVVSRLQHSAAQEQARDDLRARLAAGTAPIGPYDADGYLLGLGEPLAYLEIAELGLSKVVLEGTTPDVLFDGPGHRRDTPLPGQEGVSVLFGRRTFFGGPFGHIDELEQGDAIVVTTGQGEFVFEVLGVRREGDPVPPPLAEGGARLTLATAAGGVFAPNGVVRVDADLVGTAVGGEARALTNAALSDAEQAMGSDTRTLWALALWLQLLTLLAIAAVWAWVRWSRPHAWVVFVPILVVVALEVAGEAARLLPNLT
jgi:hypothetical protein